MVETPPDEVLYEVVDSVAVISLNRPQKANAQTPELLDQLHACWERAAHDRAVRVIVVRANGKHFSAGHDLTAPTTVDWEQRGLEAIYEFEAEKFLGYSRRWRDIPKPSIAAVQGKCIAAGLMLCWPCDLIVAAEDAEFSDPVVRMGIGGVEYHGHTWELGARKAKELLFTARSLSADEAHELGMVNRVVPLDELDAQTMALAHEIAQMHPFGLAQAKRAVNQTLDIQGFYNALQAVFDVHQTGHGNALAVAGTPILVGLDTMREANRAPDGRPPQ